MTTDKASAVSRFFSHGDRESALGEMHARPHLSVDVPSTLFHLAFFCDNALAVDLLAKVAKTDADPKLRFTSGTLLDFHVKLERHTEFLSCTLRGEEGKTAEDALEALEDLVGDAPVDVLVALQIIISDSPTGMLKQTAFGERTYGGTFNGTNEVRTTLKPDENGFVTFSVQAPQQTANELGRRIQRLIEFETYRMLCLLGLPMARRTSGTIAEIDAKLSDITSQIERSAIATQEEVARTFDDLVDLSAQANALRAETKFRFSASRAYHALVEDRIEISKETKSGDIQRLSSFVRSRLNPAIATIENVVQRQAVLSDDLGRALTLLRARIELSMNRTNQASLQSLNTRHRQQLAISQTVEGLSIIAITYYAVGLLGFIFKAADKAAILPTSVEVATGVAIPVVLFGVAWALRRVRKGWDS